MKHFYKTILTFIIIGSIQQFALGQSTNWNPILNNAYNPNGYLGWNFSNGTNPLTIRTNNTTRIHINGNGISTNGVNASGFIGIGTNVPSAPLHIVGNQVANAQGWTRGLTLSNNATIQWEVTGASGFFMAHPSTAPNGNWFAGINTTAQNNSAVDYVYTIFVNDNFGGFNPLGTTQFFKNLLVYQPGFERRFGVNVNQPDSIKLISI